MPEPRPAPSPPARPRQPGPEAARTAGLLALLSLLVWAASVALLLSGPDERSLPAVLVTVLPTGVAPALLSLGVVVLLRDVGVLDSRAARTAAVAATAAWALGTTAALSWAVGFDEGDQGLPRTPFSEAFVPLLVASLVVGAVALWPVAVRIVARGDAPARRVPTALLAAVASVALAVGAFMPMTMSTVAFVLLVACALWWWRGRRTAVAPAASHA